MMTKKASFNGTQTSADARTLLIPALVPIVEGESGAAQVHGPPLESEPHGATTTECDVAISLYWTTA